MNAVFKYFNTNAHLEAENAVLKSQLEITRKQLETIVNNLKEQQNLIDKYESECS